jgi:hypothetical protein
MGLLSDGVPPKLAQHARAVKLRPRYEWTVDIVATSSAFFASMRKLATTDAGGGILMSVSRPEPRDLDGIASDYGFSIPQV